MSDGISHSTYLKNVMLVQQKVLLLFFKRNKNLQKFIFASTAASHPPARMDGIVPLATLDGYNFANCYEYTKYICEKYLREQTDFPWMVVRFPLVKGFENR